MKFLVLFTFVAAASASYIPGLLINHDGTPVEPLANQIARAEHAQAHLKAQLRDAGAIHGIYGPQFYGIAPALVPAAAHGPPVIGPKGVPIELPANQIARAEHAQAVLEAELRNGDVRGIFAPAVAAWGYAPALAPVAAHGPPVIGPKGVPIELPANQIARAEHAQAVLEAELRNGDVAIAGLHAGIPAVRYISEPAHLALGPNGVPVEPLANQIARAEHAAAYAKAAIAAAHSRKRRSIPSIGPNGVPIELPANQLARAQHAQAVLEAELRNGDVALAQPIGISAWAPRLAYAPALIPASHTYPALKPDGQPIETPEVQHAKAAHFAAHAEAKARLAHAEPELIAYSPYGYASYATPLVANGVPLDEPIVAQAKLAHLNILARAAAGIH